MGTKNNLDINSQLAHKFYYNLYLFRRFEEVVAKFYRSGKIAGFCHLYIGQEAVVTGIDHFMTKNDSVITSYRDHIHALLYGGNIKSVLAELCGKAEGMIGAKGGSMHFFNQEHKFYGGQAIVGTTVPLGAGLAFAHKYNNDGGVSVAYIGDGAVLQGQVAETFNMASLWNLPLIIVVENNHYAMGTSVKRSHANKDISLLGVPYNIKSINVNGMDLISVLNSANEAFNHVRSNKGPIMLNVETYRYRGHSMSDPAKYRSREEVDLFREKNDPILNFANYVTQKNLLTNEQIKTIQNDIEAQLQEAEEYIKTTQEPQSEELYTKVYKD
ncbi:UNVERIFIED_CONTAM: hypothetical protein PYX00_011088 [Menopon gallinae]|uniref:Pyruvate dehydrogenase E1 component subunit alpha n=1 Tax=Menopon gallinae TaxID=328185 RepID=A0AAW2H668_9NEOP